MDQLQCFIVDAFCHGQLRGNAAAVVMLAEHADEDWMLAVAAEFQLSETAFLAPTGEDNHWQLRWFTPTTEVKLCGHATLASAHAIWQHLGATASELLFSTKSGLLRARREPGTRIALHFPAGRLDPLAADPSLENRLGLKASRALQAGEDLLLVLKTTEAVRDYRPDFTAIAKLPWRGLIITAREERDEIDFASRFFAPKVGVPEDPVTGAVHCCLALYWAEQLDKSSLVAEQWSARGGRLHLHLDGDRVRLAGEARTFLSGQLHQ